MSGWHYHSAGVPAFYAAMTVELAVLEKFVHTEEVGEESLVLVTIDLPGGPALCLDVAREDLPEVWDSLDGGDSVTAFGTALVRRRDHLRIRVPSVIGRRECGDQSGAPCV